MGIGFQRDFLASPHSCSLAWACLALPGPCSLAPNLEVVSITCLLYLEALLCLAETAGQVEQTWVFESQCSLQPSGTAIILYTELSLAPNAVGSHSSPFLSEDQGCHLSYQYRAEVIPFSAAYLVSLSEIDVSTVGVWLYFCFIYLFIFFFKFASKWDSSCFTSGFPLLPT